MKRSVKMTGLFLLFSLWCGMAKANRIDSLQTDQQVSVFLTTVNENFNSPKYEKMELRSSETIRKEQSCEGIADEWQVKNWEKADFNSDGLTDLLVTLYWYSYGVYVVIDRGNNKFELLPLSYNIHDKCKLAKPILRNGVQYLLFYGRKDAITKMVSDTKAMNQVDTLVFQYGDFLELNRSPSNYMIDSIEFHTSYCFGSCPVFNISMDRQGNADYKAGPYNPKEGNFTTILKKQDLEDIVGIVNYISANNLRENYSVSWTDDQTAFLRIRFSNGTIKEIQDYGMRGTFGLRLLYNKFFSLRTSQDWKSK